ncbi:MAG: sodium:proton antiporter [Acidimicrobiia bacterium]|nr:sodium:proton antiporter [Acidimicrobiia bacterium]
MVEVAARLIAADGSTIGPALAVIVGAGMMAQWLAWRLQLPSILALLVAGILLGPGLGVVDPDELLGDTLFPLVSLSVALILFEGGLGLPPRELRSTGTVVRRLITVGLVVTFVVGWYSSRELFDISNEAAIMIGAVVVVTGPTVVGPLLKFVRPAGRTGPILRAEGVLIDPVGAVAALLAFEVVLAETVDEAAFAVAWVLLVTILAGAGIGLAAAWALDNALKRFLIPDQLAVPVTLAVVIASFVLANAVREEAGLLTVTVIGIYLARRDSSTIRQVSEFNESLRTLLISAVFILLAARIDADQLRHVVLPALGFIAVLVFVARPIGVFLSTLRTSLTWRERLFLMTMAPRGIVAAAVSAIFAIRLEQEDVADADQIVPIVILVVIGTIVVYGFAAGPAARALGLAEAQADGVLIAGATGIGRGLAIELDSLGVKTLLIDTDRYNVTRAIAAGLNARMMSALAEEADRDLDLRGIGRMLAMTSNDEVNALATNRFGRVFGRREVFQLAPSRPHSAVSTVPEEYLGRVIGIDGITYRFLDERSRQGWRMRAAPCGPLVDASCAAGAFVPVVRVLDGRMAFLCHHDAVPATGDVVGLAAPEFQRRLDDPDSYPAESNPSPPTSESG